MTKMTMDCRRSSLAFLSEIPKGHRKNVIGTEFECVSQAECMSALFTETNLLSGVIARLHFSVRSQKARGRQQLLHLRIRRHPGVSWKGGLGLPAELTILIEITSKNII